MTRRSLHFCFISLLLGGSARAAFQVELRPLERTPYGRSYRPLYGLGAAGAVARVEGAGVKLEPGLQVVFDVPLAAPARARVLELQLGYLSIDETYARGRTCRMVLDVNGHESTHDVPLRSIHPAAEKVEDLASRYDYLLPQVAVPVEGARLRVAVRVASGCGDGQTVLFDPKVWSEHAGAPRRLILLVSDELAGGWFTEGRSFAPNLMKFFAGPGSLLTTAVSNSTNTFDTVRILGRMRFVLRLTELLKPAEPEPPGGLVPSFLAAGYDAPCFSSNVLLSTTFEGIGFRNIYDLDSYAKYEPNRRHPEILAAMAVDWLHRHPDHDALVMVWLASTHHYWEAPRIHPDFDLARMPYKQFFWNSDAVASQGRALSYEDLALEGFLADPLVGASDVLFFADHSFAWDMFRQHRPSWSTCDEKVSEVGQNLLTPAGIDIPIGVRLHERPFAEVPRVETSLIDWVWSVVRRHDPKIDTAGWEGHDVAQMTDDTPILVAGHPAKPQHAKPIARAAMRIGGRQIDFAETFCTPNGPAIFKNLDHSPASAEDVRRFVDELAARGLVHYRKLELERTRGADECRIGVTAATALDDKGAPAGSLALDTPDWFVERALYLPTLLGGEITLRADPDGCADVQAGLLRRPIAGEIALLGGALRTFLDAPREPLRPGARSIVRAANAGEHVRRGPTWVQAQRGGAAREDELNSQLKAAMKRWGYIQDDGKK
jgi:hypothetical protein